jgi:hypothetical protein
MHDVANIRLRRQPFSNLHLLDPPPLFATSERMADKQSFFQAIEARVRSRSRTRSRNARSPIEILPHRGLLPLVEMESASLSRDGVPNHIQPPRLPLYKPLKSDPWRGRRSTDWLSRGWSATETARDLLKRRAALRTQVRASTTVNIAASESGSASQNHQTVTAEVDEAKRAHTLPDYLAHLPTGESSTTHALNSAASEQKTEHPEAIEAPQTSGVEGSAKEQQRTPPHVRKSTASENLTCSLNLLCYRSGSGCVKRQI